MDQGTGGGGPRMTNPIKSAIKSGKGRGQASDRREELTHERRNVPRCRCPSPHVLSCGLVGIFLRPPSSGERERERVLTSVPSICFSFRTSRASISPISFRVGDGKGSKGNEGTEANNGTSKVVRALAGHMHGSWTDAVNNSR